MLPSRQAWVHEGLLCCRAGRHGCCLHPGLGCPAVATSKGAGAHPASPKHFPPPSCCQLHETPVQNQHRGACPSRGDRQAVAGQGGDPG